MDDITNKIANGLTELGLKKGEFIATFLPNSFDSIYLWVGAATRVTGATLLTADKDFLPLRDGKHLDVILLDAMTGWRLS